MIRDKVGDFFTIGAWNFMALILIPPMITSRGIDFRVTTFADMVSWLSRSTPRSRAVSTAVIDYDRTLVSRAVISSACCREPDQ